MESVASGFFLMLGLGMLINYLKVSEKFSYLLNLTAFSPEFSWSPPVKGGRNALVKT